MGRLGRGGLGISTRAEIGSAWHRGGSMLLRSELLLGAVTLALVGVGCVLRRVSKGPPFDVVL